jgi:acetyl-CoA acetyltransferase
MADAAYRYDAVRTPCGRHGGALAGVRPDDLAAHVVRELTIGWGDVEVLELNEAFAAQSLACIGGGQGLAVLHA